AGLLGEFQLPSSLRITAWPTPVTLTVKTPGVAVSIGAQNLRLSSPYFSSTRVRLRGLDRAAGTVSGMNVGAKLTCPSAEYSKAAGAPPPMLACRQVPRGRALPTAGRFAALRGRALCPKQ